MPGQLIASSLWNNEFTNLFNNLIPAGIDSYSTSDAQMQIKTDPFPGGVLSRPTSLAGEIERIRFMIKIATGDTFWYSQNFPSSLIGLDERLANLENFLTAPSGTVLVFYQSVAPIGWTQFASPNDRLLRVVNTSGGGAGGTNNISAGLSHSHTVNSHTHDLANHTHTMANHTHTGAAHTHSISGSGWGTGGSSGAGQMAVLSGGGAPSDPNVTNAANAVQNTGSTTPGASGVPNPNISDGPSTNTSGAATPGTDVQSPTFKWIDVIVCSKN